MPAKQSRDGPLVCRVAPRGTTSLKLFLVASGLQDLAHAARRPARRQARGVGWEGTRVGGGGGVSLQSASVLVAGRGARAHAMHEGLVGLALAGLGPPLAALVVVVAHRRAHLRREEGHTSACACGLSGGARRRGGVGVGGAGRGAAHPARVRALLHHRERVVDALARIGPDLTLRRVLVGALDALAHAAAVGALLVPAGRHAGRSARTARKGWEEACAVAVA